MKNFVLLLILCCLQLSSCKKENDTEKSDRKIELYLLKSFTKAVNGYAININSVVLNDTALIKYEDIQWYDSVNYTFKISDKPAIWLNDVQYNQTHERAFAITIEKRIIYTGYFWAGFSSAICDWIVIDPLNYSGKNELTVNLGYPGLMPGMNITDNRNDKELLEILRLDKKLK